MTIELKNVKFKDISTKYAGQICIHVYGDTKKCLAFTPLDKPIDSNIRCGDCGWNIWNATNFGNHIHFCPNKVLKSVTITDFKAIQIPALHY